MFRNIRWILPAPSGSSLIKPGNTPMHFGKVVTGSLDSRDWCKIFALPIEKKGGWLGQRKVKKTALYIIGNSPIKPLG